MNIDVETLREDLIEYFGTAAFVYPAAIIDIIEVENADSAQLIEIAKRNGFNLDNYIIEPYSRKLFR